MTHQLDSFLIRELGFNGQEKLLLAISGGIDSMVLWHMIHAANWRYCVAHCNFNLRGEASDGDAQFVRTMAAAYNVEMFSIDFDTQAEATNAKESTQMAARRLRYTWLEKIRKEAKCSAILTGHHADDSVETILINLINGTGLKGISGIPKVNGQVVRPMLSIGRDAICRYAAENALEWREDASNKIDKYVRNKVRQHIMPVVKEINPGWQKTFAKHQCVMAESTALYQAELTKYVRKAQYKRGADTYIAINYIQSIPAPLSVLTAILAPLGFNYESVRAILETTIDSCAGKQFLSEDYILIKDRRFWIVTQRKAGHAGVVMVNEGDSLIAFGEHKMSIRTGIITGQLDYAANKAYVPSEFLEFPLQLRQWKQGDYFYPLGMDGKKKKLSRFFIDQKVPRHQKEHTWILFSGERVVWVVGMRLDERFKVQPYHKELVCFEVVE